MNDAGLDKFSELPPGYYYCVVGTTHAYARIVAARKFMRDTNGCRVHGYVYVPSAIYGDADVMSYSLHCLDEPLIPISKEQYELMIRIWYPGRPVLFV